MLESRTLTALIALPLAILTSGCRGTTSGDASGTGAGTGAPTAKAAGAKAAKSDGVLTTGKLSTRKTKVGYTILLPPGIRAQNDGVSPSTVAYRKGPNDFDGYNVSLTLEAEGRHEFATAKASLMASFLGTKANKPKLIDQGDLPGGGWYFTGSFTEGGKSEVMLRAYVAKGDAGLVVTGDGTGALANDPAKTSAALIDIAKSIVVTSP